jgi:hypothetical protein
MPSIPVDVLREILGHVGKNNLATLCRVNKICCSCSQDVLYREIHTDSGCVIWTLAQSADLARRVRSFKCPLVNSISGLATALKNMSLLRTLDLGPLAWSDTSFLDGCTFKLDSFTCNFPYSESLQPFLNSQPSLTNVTLYADYKPSSPFDETFLPNLTHVAAYPSSLRILIPGRPVRSVTVFDSDDYELSYFTLSTDPIQKLTISYDFLFPKPGSLLASLFPSLVHLTLEFYPRDDFMEWHTQCVDLCFVYLFNKRILSWKLMSGLLGTCLPPWCRSESLCSDFITAIL